MTDYRYLDDGEALVFPDDAILFVACCDCGLVHQFVSVEHIDSGRSGILTYRDDRRTAQMRRHGNINLRQGKIEKWKLVRR